MSACVERPGDPRAEQRVEVEYAADGDGIGSDPFPRSWGYPKGRRGSAERKRWITSHVGTPAEQRERELRNHDVALAATMRRAELLARKGGPR